MRIAIVGISVENGSFSPIRTNIEDFVLLRGQELIDSDRYPFLHELEAEFVPAFFARAWPGGEIEPAVYQALKSELLERLAACGAVDGVYLDLHGAMKAAEMEDTEADLTKALSLPAWTCTAISATTMLHKLTCSRPIAPRPIAIWSRRASEPAACWLMR